MQLVLEISKIEASRLISPEIEKELSSPNWNLSTLSLHAGDRSFRDRNVIELYKKIKECRAQTISFGI